MLKNLALLIVSALITLAFGEAICRFLYSPIDKEMSTFKVIRDSAYIDDDELGWVPKPSFRSEHRLPHNQMSSFSTNSLGLRDREIELKKRAGVQRIVVAGDSFAWGWGVNDGDNFASRLMIGRPDREVINLGVINYNVVQEMKYFERVGEQLQPDVVLLAFCMNDIVGSTYDFLARRVGRPPARHEPARGMLRVKQTIADHSVVYQLANDVVMTHRGLMRLAVRLGLKDVLNGYEALDYNVRPFLKQYPLELANEWNTAMAQVLQFKSITDAHGVRLIVAIIPALQSVERSALEGSLATSIYETDDFDLDRPYGAIASLAQQSGIEFINPTAAFRAAESLGIRLYLKGDMHFNAEGHRLFAKTIADYLDGAARS